MSEQQLDQLIAFQTAIRTMLADLLKLIDRKDLPLSEVMNLRRLYESTKVIYTLPTHEEKMKAVAALQLVIHNYEYPAPETVHG